MAAGLNETKKRIKSIETTKKITRAMQLVATAKFSRSFSVLEKVKKFYTTVYDTMFRLLSTAKDLSFLDVKTESTASLHIIITSSLGLCGAYNSNMRKKVEAIIKPEDKLMIIGSKGYSQWKHTHEENIVMWLHDANDSADYSISQKIGNKAYEMYMKGEVTKITLTYTKFVNSVTFEATTLQLLPIDKKIFEDADKTKTYQDIEFEPDVQTVLKSAIPIYLNSLIFGASNEAKVSENASRRNAMETATDNAEDLRQDLLIKYNRARQSEITQEISEIIAGADAT